MQASPEKERVESLQVLPTATSMGNSNKNNDSEENSLDRGTNLLLELIPSDMWHTHLKWMLTKQDLQHLGIVGLFANKRDEKSAYGGFFTACHEAYREKILPERAEQLRDLLYHYKYDEVKALIAKDPLVLTVRLEYYPNRWAEEENIPSLGQLSALEYVWRMGDANFIELFGTYHEKLPEESFDRKAAMEALWLVHREALALGFKTYGGGGTWNDFKQTYYSAPQWVYGLEYLIWDRGITIDKLDEVALFSPEFLASAACGWPGCHMRFFTACCCLSVALTHPRTAARTALKLPEQSLIVIVNKGHHSPRQ